MIKQIKILVGLICLVTSFSAISAAGWSGTSKINGIYVLNETTALIKLQSFSNPHNCNIDSNGDVILNPVTQKTWFTVFLSAYMAGKPVNVYVVPSCGKTHWVGPSYGNIGHVRM
ncbi:hypothetical protein VINI7043_12471 [Vibrio nigripulchritudo ATCC 27043]|uniref:hypothetical protein n=1 Tax=Vibrio nigripulchritudo TaxID=28173 RepID=UPI00021C41DF|nr:hypothetical protein [Vibrio nigripulchritudo]EGU57980.1 hypothetical protein VINI7043_12471 [Vibrio nigripulchritudo ATCC 27043]